MSLLQRKTFTIGLVALVFWFGHKALQIHSERIEIKSQVSELESRVADIDRNNQFLASSSAYFGSDSYLERQARLKLNYKLQDEQVAFVYQDTGVKTSSSSSKLDPRSANIPNWQKWWYYLLGQ